MRKLLFLLVLSLLFSNFACAACFTSDTQILTQTGKKPVQEIDVGDQVLGQNGTNTVLEVFTPKLGEQLVYSINNGRFFVTNEHPFMSTDGWKAIDPQAAKRLNPQLQITKLEKGDVLIKNSGKVKVNSLTPKELPENTSIYNFEVSGDKTYYADGYLVHNKCFPPGTNITMANGSKEQIENIQSGQKVLTYDTKNDEKRTGKVGLVDEVTDELYILNNGLIEVSNQHPFYTKKDGEKFWAVLNREATVKQFPSLSFVKNLEIGDKIYTQDNEWVTLKSIEKKPGDYTAYNLINVGEDKNYYANELLVHNEGGGGGSCFPADTQINMSEGSKPIQEIEVGDMVKSYNTKTNEYVDKEVTALDFDYTVGSHAEACESLGDAPSLYTINGLIEFTPEHPFYVRDNGTKWAALVPYENQHPGKTHELKEGQEILAIL